MPKKGTAPTMKDVAQEAGVALGTVSKVVNGIPVGKVYQKKVEDAIKKLNYQVNSYAQGLRSSSTYTVALLIPDTINPFFGRMTYYVSRALANSGYRTLLCCTNASPEMEQSLIDMAQQNKVDSIIGLTYSLSLQIKEGTPLVTIDRHIGRNVPCVSSDNFGGGQMAVRKLVERGCTHLLYLGTHAPIPNEPTKRRDGFLSACVSMNVPYEIVSQVDGDPEENLFLYLQNHIIDGKLAYDGIFCATDTLASRVVSFLRQQGIRIPEDVQVIGFDGIRNFVTGKYLCSTIVQPIEKMANASVELALSREWSKTPPLVSIPVEYAPGGTTRD